MPLTLSLTEALQRLLDQVLTGGDAVLDGPGAPSALDGAAALLAAQRCRVLRASAAGPGGLDLPGLMAQVTRQPDLAAQDGASLEQGAQALTRLDDSCDRVVLLLDGAGELPAVTLRYLQLTCRTSASLRLVLAGRPEALDGPEFGYLRARLSARPVLVPEDTSAVPPSPGASLPGLVALPAERSRPAVFAVGRMWSAAAVLGMAVCLALGVFIGSQAPASPAAPAPAAPAPVAAAPTAVPPAAMVDATAAGPAMTVVGAAAPAADPAGAEPRTVVPAVPLSAAPAPVAASLEPASTRAPFNPPPAAPSAPMRQPPQPLAFAPELFPVPPMPPPNRAVPVYRHADMRRRGGMMAAGRSALFPRLAAARSPTRGRFLGRAYEPRATQWDDFYGPAPGWQPGDRGWLPPRAYPGDAYAGQDYPYGP